MVRSNWTDDDEIFAADFNPYGVAINQNAAAIASITASTTAVGVGSINLGHATDTTLSRSAAGVVAVENVVVPTVSSTSTLTNKTLTAPMITAASGTSPTILAGAGTPESVVTASVGSLYLRNNGGPGTSLYLKESGTGNTGWTAIGGTGSAPAPVYPDITGYINVRNSPYNAVGNGTADDTTAIQSALNDAASTSTHGVYFPAGTYMISAALVYTNNHKLVGADPLTTTIRNLTSRASSNTMMLTRSGHGISNVVVHSLNFDQRGDFYDVSLNRQHGSSPNLDFTGTVNALIENVHIHNSRTIAVYCDNANSLAATTGLTVQFCHLFQAYGGGISVFGKMSDIDIHYNILEHCNDDAIAIQDKSDGSFPTDVRITNNTILNCDQTTVGPTTGGYVVGATPHGILLFGSDQVVVANNTVIGTFASNLQVGSGSIRRATNSTVTNNVLTGAGTNNPGGATPAYGLFLVQADNVSVSGNAISGALDGSFGYWTTGTWASTGVTGVP